MYVYIYTYIHAHLCLRFASRSAPPTTFLCSHTSISERSYYQVLGRSGARFCELCHVAVVSIRMLTYAVLILLGSLALWGPFL